MNSMKKLVSIFTVLILMLSSVNLYSQPQQPPRHEARDGGFTEFQIQVLTNQLRLNSKVVEPFKKLYLEYSNKMDELQPKPQKRPTKGEQQSKPSSADIEAQILESFSMAERSTALKREYYHKFREILTPDQILKMYNTERRIRDRIVTESTNRTERENN